MSRRTINLLYVICIVAAALVWLSGPRNTETLYAKCWHSNTDPASGVAACDQLLEDSELDQEAVYQVRYLRQFGLRASGNNDAALQELLSLQGSDWEKRYRASNTLSKIYAEAEDYGASVQALETALLGLPADYPIQREAGMRSRLAWYYEALGRLDQAVLASEEAMALASGDSYTIEIRAWLHRQAGEYEAALQTLLKALENGPSDDWPLTELPRLLTQMNRQEELGQIVEGLLQANPDLRTVAYRFWFEMADEYSEAEEEDYLKTAEAFERGFEIVPEDAPVATIANAWSRLSWRYQKLDRFEEARIAAQNAYDTDPTHAYSLRHKAWLHRLDGEYDQALDLIVRALAAEPVNEWAIGELDRILALTGRLSEFPEYLTPVIKRATEAEELAFERGTNLIKQGRGEVAVQIFYSLMQHDPDDWENQRRFLDACLGAGDDCPPLWPEKRQDRPEITCEKAIELSAVTEFGILGPLESGISTKELLQDPDTSWRVASAAYVGATILQTGGTNGSSGGEIKVAQAIILYDTIMGCFPGSEASKYYREFIRSQSAQEVNGEQVFFHDLYFHENLRQNRLDLAWEVKGYDLNFVAQPTQE